MRHISGHSAQRFLSVVFMSLYIPEFEHPFTREPLWQWTFRHKIPLIGWLSLSSSSRVSLNFFWTWLIWQTGSEAFLLIVVRAPTFGTPVHTADEFAFTSGSREAGQMTAHPAWRQTWNDKCVWKNGSSNTLRILPIEALVPGSHSWLMMGISRGCWLLLSWWYTKGQDYVLGVFQDGGIG